MMVKVKKYFVLCIVNYFITRFLVALLISVLVSCMEKGLLPSLSYRSTSRLYATSRLVELTLNPSSHELGLPRLHAVCTDNKMEENLNNLAEDLAPAEFAVPPGNCIIFYYIFFVIYFLLS